MPLEAELHTLLIGGPCIIQSEQLFHIVEIAKGGDECDVGLVHLHEGYLVVTRVGIHEAQDLTPSSEVNDLVDLGKRERILRTRLA
jgi:hypothetical protein